MPDRSPDGVPQLPHVPDHELLGVIGQGAYGEVWLARNAVGTPRAVKVVQRRTFERDEHFEREFKGLQQFEPVSRTHEGLMDILHLGRHDEAGYFYYVMELADDASASPKSDKPERMPSDRASGFGSSSDSGLRPSALYLPRTLRHELRTHGPLSVDRVLDLGLRLSAALAHLHERGLRQGPTGIPPAPGGLGDASGADATAGVERDHRHSVRPRSAGALSLGRKHASGSGATAGGRFHPAAAGAGGCGPAGAKTGTSTCRARKPRFTRRWTASTVRWSWTPST